MPRTQRRVRIAPKATPSQGPLSNACSNRIQGTPSCRLLVKYPHRRSGRALYPVSMQLPPSAFTSGWTSGIKAYATVVLLGPLAAVHE